MWGSKTDQLTAWNHVSSKWLSLSSQTLVALFCLCFVWVCGLLEQSAIDQVVDKQQKFVLLDIWSVWSTRSRYRKLRKGLFSGLHIIVLLLWPHVGEEHKRYLQSLFYNSDNIICKTSTFKTSHLSGVLAPNTISLRIKFQHTNFGGNINLKHDSTYILYRSLRLQEQSSREQRESSSPSMILPRSHMQHICRTLLVKIVTCPLRFKNWGLRCYSRQSAKKSANDWVTTITAPLYITVFPLHLQAELPMLSELCPEWFSHWQSHTIPLVKDQERNRCMCSYHCP